jgi:hypothetical protein
MGDAHDVKADRAAFLSKLARDPSEAMRRWKSLSESEKLTVQSQLKTYFGEEFTQQFLAGMKQNPRPDATIEMVRRDRITTEKLKSAGYRFKNNAGGVEKWIHPSGKEVWLYSAGKGVPPTPDPPEPPVARPQAHGPQNMTIGDADEWLEYLRAKLKLIRDYDAKTKSARAAGGNYTLGDDVDHFNKMVAKEIDDAAEVIKDLNKTLDGGNLTDSEQADIMRQLEELHKLKKELDDMS